MGIIDECAAVPETALCNVLHRIEQRQHLEDDVVVADDFQIPVVRPDDIVDTAAEFSAVFGLFGVAAGSQPINTRRRSPLLQGQFFIPEGIRHIDDRPHPDLPDGIDGESIIESVTHPDALGKGERKRAQHEREQ